MSRYTGPSWKQSRRLGFSLTGTGKELAPQNAFRLIQVTCERFTVVSAAQPEKAPVPITFI